MDNKKKPSNQNSYRFFQNKDCEFFPCHKVAKKEDFNCLFCYCPIYSLKDKCGGDFTYLENGVKDCSNCTLPHLKENYQIIVDRVSILVDKVKINNDEYKISKLLVATSNEEKVVEIKEILKDLPVEILYLKDFDKVTPPEEKELTFNGNALLKARYYSRRFNIPVLADDSGLCVAGLDGFPGVKSARWMENDSYKLKNKKLIEMVEQKVPKQRQAKFVCAVALYDNKINFERVFFGEWRGHIAKKPAGKNGFGYDPIFLVDKFKKTAAQLDAKTKNFESHRAKALQGFMAWLSFFS